MFAHARYLEMKTTFFQKNWRVIICDPEVASRLIVYEDTPWLTIATFS